MIVKKVSFLLALLFPILGLAQVAPEENDEVKYWGESELVLDELKGEPVDSSDAVCGIRFDIFTEYSSFYADTITYNGYSTHAYLSKTQSWVKDEHYTETTRLYAQTILNYTELYSRLMQKKLNRDDFESEEILKDTYMYKCNETLQKLNKETAFGSDEKMVKEWYMRSKQELKDNPREKTPPFHYTKKVFGYYIGTGISYLDGTLSDYLKNQVNVLEYGIGLKSKKNHFDAKIAFGLNKTKQKFTGSLYSLESNKLNTSITVDFSYGYEFLPMDRWNIYPFVGAGFLQYSTKDKETQGSKTTYGPHRFLPHAGLNVSRTLKYLSLSSSGRKDLILNCKLIYNPIRYTGPLNGETWSVLLGIGINFNAIEFND